MSQLIPQIDDRRLLNYINLGLRAQPDWTQAKEAVLETSGCHAFTQLTSGRLAYASGNKTITIWKEKQDVVPTWNQSIVLTTRKMSDRILIPLSDDHLAIVGKKTIKIWKTTSGECVGVLFSYPYRFTHVIRLSDKRFAECVDGSIFVRDFASMTFPTFIDETCVFFSKLQLGHVRVGEKARAIACSQQSYQGHCSHEGAFHFIRLSNNLLASASKKEIKIWDVTSLVEEEDCFGYKQTTFKCVAKLDEGLFYIKSLVRLSDTLLAIGDDTTIKIWDVNLKNCWLLGSHDGSVRNLVRLSDELLASHDKKTIKIWDLTLKNCWLLGSHDGSVRKLVQLSDELLASHDKKTIKIWDFISQQCVGSFGNHTSCFADLTQLDTGQLASRDKEGLWKTEGGALKLWTPKLSDNTYNVKAFAKVLNTLSDRGINVMSQCLDAMKTTDDPELVDSFNYILSKGHEWIAKEFYDVLENIESFLTIERINKMLERLVCTADIEFPYILICKANKSPNFTPKVLKELNQIFIDKLKYIANRYVYSTNCKTNLDVLLKDIKKQIGIDSRTKYDVINNAIDCLNKYNSIEIKQQLAGMKSDITNLGNCVVKLHKYVTESEKRLQSQLDNLAEAIRKKEKISTIVSCVNVVIGIIPFIGPITNAVGDVLVKTYTMILNSSGIDPALSLLQNIPHLLQENSGSIIKQTCILMQKQLLKPEQQLKVVAEEILTAGSTKPLECMIGSEISNVEKPNSQPNKGSLQIPVSNLSPLQFANFLSANSKESSSVSSKNEKDSREAPSNTQKADYRRKSV